MSNRAFKYRLYPNKQQKIFFAKTFGCCCKIYNLMLADKILSYENNKTFGKQTPAISIFERSGFSGFGKCTAAFTAGNEKLFPKQAL